MDEGAERRGYIVLDSWSGLRVCDLVVVGETPKHYRVRALAGQRLHLPGRARWIEGEQTALVPMRHVTLREGRKHA